MPIDIGLPSAQTNVPDPQDPQLPVDQTASSIAEILGLDLSNCNNTDQGTQIVVDAIYQLIEQFQQCAQDCNDLQQQVQDLESQLEEANQPEPGEEDEVDPTAPVTPTDDPQEQTTIDPNLADQQNPKARPPQAANRKNGFPSAKKKTITASHSIETSFSPTVQKMVAENRLLKIDALAKEGFINGAVASQLIHTYTSPEQIALSLSSDSSGNDSQFDLILSAFQKNGKVIDYTESKFLDLLEVGQSPSGQAQKSFNPMVEDAEQRKTSAT